MGRPNVGCLKEEILFVSQSNFFLGPIATLEMLQNHLQNLKIGHVFSEISAKKHARNETD